MTIIPTSKVCTGKLRQDHAEPEHLPPDWGLPQPRRSGGRGPQAQSPIPLCPVSLVPGGQPHHLCAGQWAERVPFQKRNFWAVNGEGSEGMAASRQSIVARQGWGHSHPGGEVHHRWEALRGRG